MEPPRLSLVVVTFNCRDDAIRTLSALAEQLGSKDELIVVDNASSDGTADAIARSVERAAVVRNPVNAGFAAAANAGAAGASCDLIVFLNPDAEPAPGFVEAIAAPLREQRGWAAWQGLVTAKDGRVVNTSGGVVHFTGVAWAGEAGRPADAAPDAPREVAFASGACLAVPRVHWLAAGGFPEHFFMYCEDVDLSLRLRLQGGRVGIEPRARVDHRYEFEKGAAKWRLLERNRWATLIRTYPGALLFVLMPALLATELALVAVALRGGWLGQKVLAWFDTWRRIPSLLGERRAIQARRSASAGEFAAALTPELGSAYLGGAGRSRVLGALLRAYWSIALRLVGSR
jgi:GT2 family glycosyltransferase